MVVPCCSCSRPLLKHCVSRPTQRSHAPESSVLIHDALRRSLRSPFGAPAKAFGGNCGESMSLETTAIHSPTMFYCPTVPSMFRGQVVHGFLLGLWARSVQDGRRIMCLRNKLRAPYLWIDHFPIYHNLPDKILFQSIFAFSQLLLSCSCLDRAQKWSISFQVSPQDSALKSESMMGIDKH